MAKAAIDVASTALDDDDTTIVRAALALALTCLERQTLTLIKQRDRQGAITNPGASAA